VGNPAIDETGKRYGRLTVFNQGPSADFNGCARFWCLCDCGERTLVQGRHLRSGHTQSCGCLNRERVVASRKKRK
jgi:hypothetical protein